MKTKRSYEFFGGKMLLHRLAGLTLAIHLWRKFILAVALAAMFLLLTLGGLSLAVSAQ